MHYGSGSLTRCRDVLPSQFEFCSDLNTTRFLKRIIQAENPDFIAFTGTFFLLSLIFFLFISMGKNGFCALGKMGKNGIVVKLHVPNLINFGSLFVTVIW